MYTKVRTYTCVSSGSRCTHCVHDLATDLNVTILNSLTCMRKTSALNSGWLFFVVIWELRC